MKQDIKEVNENNESRTIDLSALIMMYLNKWWLIIAVVFVGATVSFIYTQNFATPLYRASVSLYVNNVRNDAQIDTISSANLTAAQTLVNTYLQIIKSDRMIDLVIENNDWTESEHVSAGELKRMITASKVNETGIFILNVSSPDPRVAEKVANAMAQTIVETMGEIVEGSSVKIIDEAKVPTSPYAPNYFKNMVIGGFIAGVAVIAILTIVFVLDTKIRSADELERMFKLPVLGNIPDFNNVGESHAYVTRHHSSKD